MDISKPSGHSSHEVDHRVRELYRYFHPPTQSISGSQGRSEDPFVTDFASSARSTPDIRLNPLDYGDVAALGSYSTTLTSFAQLAALRLNVQRALIWFVVSLFLGKKERVALVLPLR